MHNALTQDLHDEVLENALEAEECAAAKRAPKCKHLNERLAEEGAIEIAPFVDSQYEVPPGDNRFLPAGDLLSSYAKNSISKMTNGRM